MLLCCTYCVLAVLLCYIDAVSLCYNHSEYCCYIAPACAAVLHPQCVAVLQSVWLVTFVAVVLLDVAFGLVVGIAYSLLTVVGSTQRSEPICDVALSVDDVDVGDEHSSKHDYDNFIDFDNLQRFL